MFKLPLSHFYFQSLNTYLYYPSLYTNAITVALDTESQYSVIVLPEFKYAFITPTQARACPCDVDAPVGSNHCLV